MIAPFRLTTSILNGTEKRCLNISNASFHGVLSISRLSIACESELYLSRNSPNKILFFLIYDPHKLFFRSISLSTARYSIISGLTSIISFNVIPFESLRRFSIALYAGICCIIASISLMCCSSISTLSIGC